jgi:sterol desaturase/sphingolipid hydroxylase (fatty acid hydroxylase superfamily)
MKWLDWQDYAYNLVVSTIVGVFGVLFGESMWGALFYGILVFSMISILQMRRAAARAQAPPTPVQKDERTEQITRAAGLYAFLVESLLLAMALMLFWAQPESPLTQQLAPFGAIMLILIAGVVTFLGAHFLMGGQA